MNVEPEKEEKEVEVYGGQGGIRCGVLEGYSKSMHLCQNFALLSLKDECSSAKGLGFEINYSAPATVKL